jgi:hypothetical protein
MEFVHRSNVGGKEWPEKKKAFLKKAGRCINNLIF